MYLKYLQIINYKNLKSTRFEFMSGSNTIIGENDAGKSNAMNALRILLDDTYYYNEKRLKESDFSYALNDWKGHWIIVSAYFDEITADEKKEDVCKEIIPQNEDQNFLKSYIRCDGLNYGTVTLFIRPNKTKRKELASAKTSAEFEAIRSGITLIDYDFCYTARSQADFTNLETYKCIVGDIDNFKYADPDNDDLSVLGTPIAIIDIWRHISIVYIDALRDVQSELHKPKNPIRRIVDTIQADIAKKDVETIKDKIRELNETISGVAQVADIGEHINGKLQEMIGMVYSPDIMLESQLRDDMNSLSKYLTMLPASQEDINQLGLGHLNIIYIALKLVEFEFNRRHELLNIMIIEEPEAHIHTHIQKTLFDNLGLSKDYTQVLMTTHSTHLSEVSEIQRVNVLKAEKNITTVMRPTNGLDGFGVGVLKLKAVSLVTSLERYLDAKRSVLLFSKGVILVEGDGEEILIPHLVKKALGITLDELGIGLVNVGSVGFENVAALFDEKRLQRYCAIITDLDVQVSGAEHQKPQAAKQGQSRKDKLDKLFKDNEYVNSYFAPHTLEIDFADIEKNRRYIEPIIEIAYPEEGLKVTTRTQNVKEKYKKDLYGNESERYDALSVILSRVKKGWYATLLSDLIDAEVVIPMYILEAIASASREVISTNIKVKMIQHSLKKYQDDENTLIIKDMLKSAKKDKDYENIINKFCEKYSDDMVSKLIVEYEWQEIEDEGI
ncbi:MAG: AAA family ATPase [Blautia producta]|nr:AAA family ATPase [Blautia producta]MDU5384446.1 AAA family ATPase [Blautia producta]MDU6885251.1 AAA family ATPase [Blautia producta]